MNLHFSPEERLFREEVQTWLSENIPKDKRPAEGPESFAFDRAWQRTQYDCGWAGIAWPKEYGGRGLSLTEQIIWLEEYARLDAPTIGSMTVALNHAGPTLIAHGTEAQKTFHLPRILRGESVWCQGFSEPGGGSDLAALSTRAILENDQLIVSGSKIWTSFAHGADFQELLIRTDPHSTRHRGITWVICDMSSPGIDVRPIVNMTGRHEFNQVFYDSVHIPTTNIVGDLNEGWKIAMATLGFERGTGTICYQVELASLVEKLIAFARTATGPDGRRPLIDDEAVMARLANARTQVSALRAMTYMNVSRAERGISSPEGVIAGLYYIELRQQIARFALELTGKLGLCMSPVENDWPRQYLASFAHAFAGGTAEIRRNIVADRVLGLPRSV